MDYGAVSINYTSGLEFYTNNNRYYYCSDAYETNHAVMIVGWDDSISASMFYDSYNSTRPANNGAWIVRNSWGSNWGNSGYFYMAYQTAAVSNAYFDGFIWDFVLANDYDRCYQYDGSSGNYTIGISSSTPYEANIFTAAQKENINAVSFWLEDHADVNYTVRVYTGLSSGSNPTSGTLAATASGVTSYAGYYTVVLPAPVTVQSGVKFSVVVSFLKNGTSYFNLPIDKSYQNGDWIEFFSYSTSGQSFKSSNGSTWSDVGTSNGGNLRIKAFASGDNVVPVTSITVSSSSSTMYLGNTMQMSAIVLPSDATNKSVTWSLISGSAYASISTSGLLTASGVGTVTVRATAKDGSGVYGEQTITMYTKPLLSSVTANRTATAVGTTVKWTANTTGGAGTKQYYYTLKKKQTNGATNVVTSGWIADRTYSYEFQAGDVGTYFMRVIARDANSVTTATVDSVELTI